MTDTFLALRAHIYVTLYSYFKKGCRQKNITRQSRKALWIWSIPCSWYCSCGTYICRFPLAIANIRPWPRVQLFERTVKTKPPTKLFGIVAFTFSKKNQPESLFGFCLVWRSNLRRSLKPLDIPDCLQAQVPSKLQRVEEGSDYTRKRRSLSDTRTGKYERLTRVACVAGGIYRAPLLHSVDAFVKLSLNLGPRFLSYLSPGVREGTSRKETWDRGCFGVCFGCIAAKRMGRRVKRHSPTHCDTSSIAG